jgi:hypothetical protein
MKVFISDFKAHATRRLLKMFNFIALQAENPPIPGNNQLKSDLP